MRAGRRMPDEQILALLQRGKEHREESSRVLETTPIPSIVAKLPEKPISELPTNLKLCSNYEKLVELTKSLLLSIVSFKKMKKELLFDNVRERIERETRTSFTEITFRTIQSILPSQYSVLSLEWKIDNRRVNKYKLVIGVAQDDIRLDISDNTKLNRVGIDTVVSAVRVGLQQRLTRSHILFLQKYHPDQRIPSVFVRWSPDFEADDFAAAEGLEIVPVPLDPPPTSEPKIITYFNEAQQDIESRKTTIDVATLDEQIVKYPAAIKAMEAAKARREHKEAQNKLDSEQNTGHDAFIRNRINTIIRTTMRDKGSNGRPKTVLPLSDIVQSVRTANFLNATDAEISQTVMKAARELKYNILTPTGRSEPYIKCVTA